MKAFLGGITGECSEDDAEGILAGNIRRVKSPAQVDNFGLLVASRSG